MKNKESTAPPNPTIKSEQTLILPGHMFFVETIDIPDELEPSEIADFAELSLESMAPFPIDQIYWGYLYRRNVSTLLVYAARRERIKNEGFTDLHDYAWVLPDFATLSGACFHDDTLVVLEGDEWVSLVYFERNAEIPKSVWLDTAHEPITKTKIQSLRSGIRDIPQTAPSLHLRPVVSHLNERGSPIFEHAISEYADKSNYDGNWQTLTPTESELWQMDVRDSDFKASEKSKRRISALISRISGWAALFALVLVLTESILFTSQSWLNAQFDKIESQQVAVSKVEEKQILVNKLEQVAQNELRPIEMLEAANNIRLELNLGIEYDSVIIEGENQITVEGKASSINAVNKYVESLEKSGLFELLSEQKPITRNGKTTFKVSLAYNPKPAPSKTNGTTSTFHSSGRKVRS